MKIRRLLFPPFSAALVLFILCCGALVRVFFHDLQAHPLSGGLYALSAWSLLALCLRLPGVIGKVRGWMRRHPRLFAPVHNPDLRFRLKLYGSQLVNLSYGTGKLAVGLSGNVRWLICDGVYNLAQAAIQLFLIWKRRQARTLSAQWRAYRLCGTLVALLHLSMAGIVLVSVQGQWMGQTGIISMIATAAFAFYKLVGSFTRLARDRKHLRPVDSAVRMLELAQAIFAVYSLQVGMLQAFGSGGVWVSLGNLAVGIISCLLTAATGIYMIRRGSRTLRTIKWEEQNGTAVIL